MSVLYHRSRVKGIPATSTARRYRQGRATTRIVAVAATAAIVAAALVANASAQDRYTDIAASVHTANIEELDEVGLFDGTECGARRFCPDDPVKRWAVAVWLVRAIDGEDPQPMSESRFADVDDDEWWMPYAERLADLGVTMGCRTNPLSFCPNEAVSRAQMASFLVRAFRLKRAAPAGFTDTKGNHHESNIDALSASGITLGCRTSPLRFCPGASVSRGQMASFINRGLNGDTSVTGPTATTTARPTAIGDGARSDDTLLAASRGQTCVVRSDGGVSCWGGDEGDLDHLAASALNDVVAVSISHHESEPLHTCAVLGNGDVDCWGSGSYGQLGTGDSLSNYLPVSAFKITDAVAVAAGADFTCAVHESGDVSCWGSDEFGQLGTRSAFDSEFPEEVTGVSDAAAIAAGEDTACVITDRGDISCWGGSYRSTPESVTGLDTAVSLSIGIDDVCAVTDRGEVYCWRPGDVRVGQSSQRISGISDAVEVSVGDDTFCVLHRDGDVSCWGENHAGQVGDGTTRYRSQPVAVSAIDDAVDISVSAGSVEVEPHSCALRSNGSVYCWGGNDLGQLADGSRRDRSTPVRARLPATVAANDEPSTQSELLVAWLDSVVREHRSGFRGLAGAWDHVRSWTFFDHRALDDPLDIDCSGSIRSLGCRVDGLTVDEISVDALREVIRVYDLHHGLAPTRSWGAAQLYFAHTYPDCFAETHPGSEILADTVLHLLVPEAQLIFYGTSGCPTLPATPNAEAERVATAAMRGRVPTWYTQNITTGTELFEAWDDAPSLPALANLADEFGGLCRTDWIEYPFDAAQFPAAASAFRNDGNC